MSSLANQKSGFVIIPMLVYTKSLHLLPYMLSVFFVVVFFLLCVFLCLQATQTEDIKDFAKVVKSKVRKKKKKNKKDPSKGRFLPIPNDNTVQASDEE